MYGGSHTSQPLISRYGAGQGDTLYAVSFLKGDFVVVGGMTVVAIVPWLDYVESHLGITRAWLAMTDTRRVAEGLAREHPEWGPPAPVGLPSGGRHR